MEGLGILIVYLVLLAAQLAMLVYCVLRPRPLFWGILLGAEALSALASWLLTHHFDNLPGSGKAPGLTYFGETRFSMGACIAYSVMLGITLAGGVFVLLHRNGKR